MQLSWKHSHSTLPHGPNTFYLSTSITSYIVNSYFLCLIIIFSTLFSKVGCYPRPLFFNLLSNSPYSPCKSQMSRTIDLYGLEVITVSYPNCETSSIDIFWLSVSSTTSKAIVEDYSLWRRPALNISGHRGTSNQYNRVPGVRMRSSCLYSSFLSFFSRRLWLLSLW